MLIINGRYNVISSGEILYWSAIYKNTILIKGYQASQFRTQCGKDVFVTDGRNLIVDDKNNHPIMNPKTNRQIKVKIEKL